MTSPQTPAAQDPTAQIPTAQDPTAQISTIQTPTAKAATAPTSASAPVHLDSATAKALTAALAAEQVAVWAYDLVAAYDPADADIIATIRSGHLGRRDATANLLVTGGAKASIPAPAYSIPGTLVDAASARALSASIEGDCAAAWRGVIGSTDNTSLRATALAGLSDSAVWLTTMKMAAKTLPATVPFPGVS